MQHTGFDQSSLDYFHCRYGSSRLLFRGPRRRLEGDFVAFLGGIETFGKFIETPFPALLEVETGVKSVNLGCPNAGIDVYFNDQSLLDICGKARVSVVEVLGAQNMSNRFYMVHPRRNDRFLRASDMLRRLYPEVDFTEFSFTRHMLQTLAETAPEKFPLVIEELQTAWTSRMLSMLSRIRGKVLLLWLADHAAEQPAPATPGSSDPMFVDRAMLDVVSDAADGVVEIVATDEERQQGRAEMVFAEFERPAAQEMLGPAVHRRSAEALAAAIDRLT